MENFDLIIFDCDGTLTDSETLNNQAWVDALHHDGFTNYSVEHAINNWVGLTVSDIMDRVEDEMGRRPSPTLTADFVRRVAASQETGLKAVDGADALIAAASKKYKICVASNGERSNVINSLMITGLKKYFIDDHVFTKSQVTRPKPAPDLFLFAAQIMGADPARCLVLEDSAAGASAGVAAGMTTFGFTGTSHHPQKQEKIFKEIGVNMVFNRLIHIQEYLAL